MPPFSKIDEFSENFRTAIGHPHPPFFWKILTKTWASVRPPPPCWAKSPSLSENQFWRHPLWFFNTLYELMWGPPFTPLPIAEITHTPSNSWNNKRLATQCFGALGEMISFRTNILTMLTSTPNFLELSKWYALTKDRLHYIAVASLSSASLLLLIFCKSDCSTGAFSTTDTISPLNFNSFAHMLES